MSTIVVTTLVDESNAAETVGSPQGAGLSLREALVLANTGDTITFAANLIGGTTPGVNDGRVVLTQGALAISSDVTIEGDLNGDHKADITLDGNNAGTVLAVLDGDFATRHSAALDGLVITHGYTYDGGGGIYVGTNDALTLTHSTVSDNSAAAGGGIFGQFLASITVTDSTVTGNSAPGFLSSGGGISIQSGASLTLTNATLSGNSASYDGGAVYGLQDNGITLVNTTVTGNQAGADGGGVYASGLVVTLINSIAAGNMAGLTGDDLSGSDTLPALALVGGNILGSGPVNFLQLPDGPIAIIDGASAVGLGTVFAQVAADPHTGVLSGVLADNGGPVATVALAASAANPALDGGSDSQAGVPAADARGLPHVDVPGVGPNGANITDIGAFELQGQFETQSLVVTTAADVVDLLDGKTSLREAIAYANSLPGADTITFDPALAGQTLLLTQGALAITRDVTIEGDIDGDHKADITIDGNHAGSVFIVDDGNPGRRVSATLDGLVITHGGAVDAGGGVYVGVNDALTLTYSTVSNSKASVAGGGIFGQDNSSIVLTDSTVSGNSASGTFFADGGGIAAQTGASVTLTNATLSGNGADYEGGAFFGLQEAAITLVNTTVTGNHAGADGGAIFDSNVTLANSIAAGNSASYGNDLYGGFGAQLALVGGNILGSTPVNFAQVTGAPPATIDGTSTADLGTVFAKVARDAHTAVLSGVLADNGGPVATVALAAVAANPALDGGSDGALGVPATDARGLPHVDVPGVAHSGTNITDIGAFELQVETPSLLVTTLSDVVDPFDGQTSLREALSFADSHPGADTVTFDPTLAGQTLVLTQGALAITSDVTIEGDINGDHKADITIDGNHAGGVFTVDDFNPGTRVSATLDGLVITHGGLVDGGGGVYVGAGEALTLTHSTVADNSASFVGGGILGQYGASITVTDSTVSGNSASGYMADGGGIYAASGASVTLTNATLSGNSASYDGGGVFGFQDNAITLVNTTVTGNQAGADGGGIYQLGASAVAALTNSIVAGNMAGLVGDDLFGNPYGASSGLVLSGGNILGSGPVNVAQVGDGQIVIVDGASAAGLGAVFAGVAADPHTGVLSGLLADNGGPVATVALAAAAANPALDGGSDSAAGVPATDARGLSRIDVPGVAHNDANITDIGAFELHGTFETASLVVTTAADVVDLFDGETSLREAVAYANSLPGAQTITFDPALAGQTLLLTRGALAIGSDLTIEGDLNGDHKADITIAANHASRVFTVDDGNSGGRVTATLDGLVITHGGGVDGGGGISVGVNDALTLSHSTVADNSAIGDQASGGGILGLDHSMIVLTDSTVSGNSVNGEFASGGGIAVQTGASVTLTNVTLSGNKASFDGGAVFGLQNSAITLVNTTVTGNHAGDEGGGVYDFGPLAVVTLVNSIAAGNTADVAGGDLAADSNGSPASLVLSGGNILGSAPAGFGPVTGAPPTTIDGTSGAALGTVFAQVALDARSGVLAGVLADNGGPVATVALAPSAANPALDGGSDGAGVPAADARGLPHVDAAGVAHNGANITDLGAFELQVDTPSLVVTTLSDVVDPFDGKTSLREAIAYANARPGADTITFNPTLAGQTLALTQGALAITSDVTIEGEIKGDRRSDITIDGNHASGVFTIDDGNPNTRVSATLDGLTVTHGGSVFAGGGIYVGVGDALTLTHSTVADNSASVAGGGILGDNGASITVTDSTVSGNSATGVFASGGGIQVEGGGSVTLTNATLSGNSAGHVGGGVFGLQDTAITLINTTLTGNHAGTDGGGIADRGALAVVMLTNSIAAGNTAGMDGNDLAGDGSYASLVLTGGNILGSTPVNFAQVSGAPSATIAGASAADLGTVFANVAPDAHTGVLAGVLADSGGPVATVALAASATNPALDGGDDALAPTADARGMAHVDVPGIAHNGGNISDIGAFELQGAFEAASLVVTTAADVVDLLDGKTSLREAIAYANSLPGADTITFAAGLAGQALVLTQGALAITSDVTIEGDIDGDHKADITIDGNHTSGVFTVDDGNPNTRVSATLDGLTVTHGGSVFVAGGIYVGVDDALTLTRSTVADNSASVAGGGILGDNGASITITDSTVSGNSATAVFASGGGIQVEGRASVTLTDATLSGNSAGHVGGAVFGLQDSAITLINTTVTGNHAGTEGGGIADRGALAVVTLTNSIAAGNTAGTDGNDLAGDANILGSSLVLTGGNILGSGPVNFIHMTGAPAATIDGASAADLGTVFANVAPDAHTGVLSGVLADNRGPVATVALAATAANPALDGGGDSAMGVPTADARGVAHVDALGIDHNGANITDIGAFELQAETPGLVVTTLSDAVDPFDGQTSLREALAYADSHPGADAITFAAGLAGGTLTLTQGQLRIASDVTIEGDINGDHTPDITIDAGGASRVLGIDSGTSMLGGLTITGGNTSSEGGGLIIGALAGTADVTVSNSLITGNNAPVGGGASVEVGSTLHLVNSTIAENFAAYAGGGVANHGTLTVVNTTVSGNLGFGGPGTAIPSAGGGLYNTGTATLADTTISRNGSGDNGGGIANSGDLTLTNVTLADNAGANHGGGLYNAAGDITINSSTFSGNLAGIGGGIDVAAGAVALVNSIVAADAGSNGADLSNGGTGTLILKGRDILGSTPFGTVDSTNGTVIQIDGADAAALQTVFAQVSTNPHTGALTGVLANNGGPVATVAIAAGGLAVDTGSNASLPADSGDLDRDNDTAEVLPVDARGLARVSGGAVDVGAFELQNTPPHLAANSPLVLDEGTHATIGAALLSYADHEQGPQDLTFTITAPVTIGALLRDGTPLGLGTTFTQADIAGGRLSYAHDGSETTSASFGFSVADGAGGVVGAQSFTIDINPVDDAPVVGPQVKLPSIDANSGAHLITQAQLLANATDVDGPTLAAIDLQIAKGSGTLVDNHDGSWSYTGAVNDDTSVTFSYQATDAVAAPVADSAILDIVPIPAAAQIGTAGDDTFTAPAGNSIFDGLGGVDTIILGFKLTDAIVSYSGNHVIIDGPSSHTVLSGFEKYVFTDGTVNNTDADPLVDDLFYYSRNHDVWNVHADADAHYHTFGWKEGRDPNAFFSTSTYLSMHPDVKAAGVDPLLQFDQSGWKRGADPSIFFDTNAYLNANPDVKAAGVDPLAHFLADGAQEGRQPIAPGVLLAQNGFDYVYYLQHNPDVAAARIDPLQHFETIGWREGRNPNAYFDTSGYLAHYGDVAAAGINPLDQYDQFGWKEGRDPSVNFDTRHYLAAYPDVAATQVDPLVHFLQHGVQEGRSSFADGDWG